MSIDDIVTGREPPSLAPYVPPVEVDGPGSRPPRRPGGPGRPGGPRRPFGSEPVTVRRRRPWFRRAVFALGIVVLLAGGLAGAGYSYFKWRWSQIKTVSLPSIKTVYSGQPFNVLVVGSDSRTGFSGAAAQAFGNSQQVQGQRSDVTMVLHIDPQLNQAEALSIPRDLFVPLANGQGSNRINAAFDSGPNELIATIEQDLNIPINHYIEVSFQGFQSVVDALGGVKMDFPYAAQDAYSGLNIPQSETNACITLNGAQALSVARSRHFQYYESGYWQYDGTSDFGRIQRQHEVMKAAIKAAEGKIFTNPIALNSFIGAVVSSLTIDNQMSASDMVTLLEHFRSFSPQSLVSYTLPTNAVNGYEDFGDVLFPVQPDDQIVVNDFLNPVGGTQTTSGAGTSSTTNPTLAPSSVSVAVYNGSGQTGIAGQVAEGLKGIGFNVPTIADASSFDYTHTVVKYGPGALEDASTVASKIELSGGGTPQVQEDYSLSGPIVDLYVGSDYSGLAQQGSGNSASGQASSSGGQSGVQSGSTTTTIPQAAVEPIPAFNPVPC